MKGVKDWVIQRATAIFLLAYFLILGWQLVTHQPLTFLAWHSLFHPLWFKILSIMAFLSVVMHAWIGLWTIFTDYLHPWGLRLVVMWVAALTLFAYFIWFLYILWGV